MLPYCFYFLELDMQPYIQVIKTILEENDIEEIRQDRTGTGTYSVFGEQMKFNLRKSFPLLTLKYTNFKLMVDELLWFLRGQTNVNDLIPMKGKSETIWHPWADKDGYCGPIYGRQWRQWQTPSGPVDQIQRLVDGITKSPFSRRHIVSAWNVADLPFESISPQENVKRHKMSIAPCHTLFQFYVRELSLKQRLKMLSENPTKYGFTLTTNDDLEDSETQEKLSNVLTIAGIPKMEVSCKMYQRSADMFLGVPFNIASYALLTHLLVNELNSQVHHSIGEIWGVGDLIITFGDTHIYSNHLSQVQVLLDRYRAVYENKFDDVLKHNDRYVQLKLPTKYNIKACMNMSDVILNADDFCQFLTGYEPMGFLGGEPAV